MREILFRGDISVISKQTGIIGGVIVGVLLFFWLVPAVISLIFSFIWFLITLPFRLLYLIFVTGLGGLLALLWRLFSGFFGLFGIVGAIVKWILVIAGGLFGAIFLYGFFKSWYDEYFGPSKKGGSQRSWALEVLGLDDSASLHDIKTRYRKLIKAEHPDRLGTDATEAQRRAAEERVEQINKAYRILTH
jgi:hypothetical protein